MSEYISIPRGAVTVIPASLGGLIGDAIGSVVTAFTGTVSFNDTKYPGICKPSDNATRLLFVALQQQLNRVAQVKGYGKIADDGDIGPATVSLVNKVTGSSYAKCSQVATVASGLTQQVKTIANGLAAPAKVSGPLPIAAPTLVTKAGVEFAAPAPSMFDSIPTPVKVAAAGMGVGIVYLLVTKKKKRRK